MFILIISTTASTGGTLSAALKLCCLKLQSVGEADNVTQPETMDLTAFQTNGTFTPMQGKISPK